MGEMQFWTRREFCVHRKFLANIKINLTKIYFYNFHLPVISDHTKNVEFYITFTIRSSNRCWM